MSRAPLQSGIELEYDTFGSEDDDAVLLIMGFTAQMTAWNVDFCNMIAAAGRFVIRFDNRDCGLSTKLDGQEVDLAAVMSAALEDEELPEVPYTLSDMAADAIGLLDHLGIDRAHVVGASMGGMIAQTIAIEHPARVRTLTSIMSSTGEPDVGTPLPEAMAVLMTPPPSDREGFIEAATRGLVFQSRKYRDPERSKQLAAAAYDRSYYPEGAPRQMAAVAASRSRAERLPEITAPTLVIHGRDDTLITPSGGVRTAELIPGANLLLLGDMGHDLPVQLYPEIVGAIATHTRPR